MKAFEIKKGNVVEHNNGVWQIRDIERSAPQGRGGNVTYRFTMYSVPGGTKLDLSLRADDELKEVDLVRRAASFSYKDGEAFVFLDDEDFTPYTLDPDAKLKPSRRPRFAPAPNAIGGDDAVPYALRAGDRSDQQDPTLRPGAGAHSFSLWEFVSLSVAERGPRPQDRACRRLLA